MKTTKKVKKRLGRPLGSKNKSKAMVAAAPAKRPYRKSIAVDALRDAADKLMELKGVVRTPAAVADAAIADIRTVLRVSYAAYMSLNFRDAGKVLENDLTPRLLAHQFMMCVPECARKAGSAREYCRALAGAVLGPVYDRMLSTPDTLPANPQLRDVTEILRQMRAWIIASHD